MSQFKGSEMKGKHALVTGGGTGVGEAIALALAEQGIEVTITGRRAEVLDKVAAKSERIHPIVADVTDSDAMTALFESAKAANGPIDIVIANAGAAQSAPFSKVDEEQWLRMLDVNLSGVFRTFKSALPDMLERKQGRLIAIASTAGLKGYSYVAPYCAAKHGVIGLTRALAIETATKGVTVNSVCPGFIDTPLLQRSIDKIMEKTGRSADEARQSLASSNPQGRLIEVDEVAGAVLWLCSDAARSVTGQTISLSGGEV